MEYKNNIYRNTHLCIFLINKCRHPFTISHSNIHFILITHPFTSSSSTFASRYVSRLCGFPNKFQKLVDIINLTIIYLPCHCLVPDVNILVAFPSIQVIDSLVILYNLTDFFSNSGACKTKRTQTVIPTQVDTVLREVKARLLC